MTKPKAIWSLLWRLTICGLLLAWIFHRIFTQEGRLALQALGQEFDQLSRPEQWRAAWHYGPRELWHTLNLVHPIAFILSLLFMGLTIFIGVWRWRLVMQTQGLHLPAGRALEISLVAHFFNSFLLGSSGGDLIKAYYAARETHHQKPEAVMTVLVDRIIGLFAMLTFAGCMMVPNLSLLRSHERLAALAGLILLMMVGCAVFLLIAFWGGLSRHWPQARHWLRALPKGDLLERALDAARRIGREPVMLAKMLGVSMILNLACVGQVMALAFGLDLHLSPPVLLLVVPIIICISAIPITPNGLGIRENLYVLMLAVPEINTPATSALSLSLLAYAGSLIWSLGGGAVYLFLRDRQHLYEVTHS
ncbi:MAG TPA: lysylphosphatidylglycerol synthase transmembrane domain-containing protein [Candidatus Paceibacterota bacterium]|nr:lysylphosphatidylglycerol synthase transmembrane domain-containing protein [Verrucomicrobiota bacterium]HRY49296.1 lysylphosphatidylglycerol synthase transmembrane domain-containing protein [Candidatus Paceibacterota bacterium]HSA01140.1 lysylphosphatidylglycerol synthase transmembrane domain-containing protein [Candidatus Paceibacterota bacterium]